MSADHGSVASLVRQLGVAVSVPDAAAVCQRVKTVLSDALQRGRLAVPAAYLRPLPTGYARRRLHLDPTGRFSVVVMVWGPGQGTPLHDHADHWCVECVYAGRIRVTSYDLERQESERALFRRCDVVEAGVGTAGALIPPFQYHTIENPYGEPAVTLHVYRGEITWCHTFEPAGDRGWFRPQRQELTYSP